MRYLQADFHCHVKIFSSIPLKPGQLSKKLNWAMRLGLDILAVTEHIEDKDFWTITDGLEHICTGKEGVYHRPGLTVLTGAEVTIREGGHILLIGCLNALKELENRLGRLDGNNTPCFKDLMDAGDDLGFLRIGAHPCRRSQELWPLGLPIKRLDALEINGRNLPAATTVARQAGLLQMPVVAGSDAHHWLQMGRVYNHLPVNGALSIAAIKEAVAARKIRWHDQGTLSWYKKILQGVRK